MSRFPSLPLFTDAFIADTMHLNATETGAYLMLLMVAWRSPDCRLPDDDSKLCRWARVDPRQWHRVRPKIMEYWNLSDGYWTQKRLLLERDKVRKYAARSRVNGTYGGRPKSLKNNDVENPEGYSDITQTKAPNPNPIYTLPNGNDGKPSGPPHLRLWIEGKASLAALGVAAKPAGSMIGRWLRDTGDDHRRVLDAIERARDMVPADAIPWITAHLKPPEKPHGKRSVYEAACALDEWVRQQARH
jgi:uncharacterized protein YdaU (DUF1376 family)